MMADFLNQDIQQILNIKKHCTHLYFDNHCFHLHPKVLINNFISKRTKTKPYAKILAQQSMSTQNENNNDDERNILSYYGFYSTLISMKLKVCELNIARDALQHYNKPLTIVCTKKSHDLFDSVRRISCLLIDMNVIGTNSPTLQILDSCLFTVFIKCYIVLNYSEFRDAINSQCKYYAIKNQCKYYNHKYKHCGACLWFKSELKVTLGYLMLFCADKIIRFIKTTENTMLKQIAFSNINATWNKHRNIVTLAIYKIKTTLDIEKLKTFGREYILDTFEEYKRKERDHVPFFDFNMCSNIFHIIGKVKSLVDGNYDIAKGYFVMSISGQNGLYRRVLSLIALSDNCYLNGEYLLGYVLLKCSYILCKEYILPSFVNKGYFKKRKKFIKKRYKIKCVCCGLGKRDGVCIKCCIGCMKVMYCSKSCQKIHWKQQHSYDCDKQWKSIYWLLKNVLIDKL
eukprot:555247_1